jgi:serine/threonine protein phosphatase PrpC
MKTNDDLLNSDINTEMSGSTVIALFIYKDTIYALNVGDSRAILVSSNGDNNWQVTSLSVDQKPSRQDEK